MGLTKPRAAQIFNLDYKQSTRVATVDNVTLTGGAPTPVDGVNVSVGDRVLVAGQSTASQNGLYQVATVGSGANGTWVRTSDGDETGEIEAGMIVMVTEGTEYGDTQWKLATNDPIVLGVTALTFVFNVQTSTISSGTSNVVVNANANVTISSAGTANVLTVSNTGAFVSGIASITGNVTGGNLRTVGIVSATGNVTGNFLIGNGSQITGITASAGTNIFNGTSNIVVQANSNITVAVSSTLVSTFANTGVFVVGLVSATGNISGNFLLGNGRQLTGLPETYGNANVVTLLSNFGSSSISTTGNITAGNLNSVNADLAEKYTADADYAPGTVVMFGGVEEVTVATQSHATQVAGIVSTQPGYVMNNTLISPHTAMVALTGRVPCLVRGPIAKGDCLVASAIAGHAERLDPAQYKPGCIIGKSLMDYSSVDTSHIEVAVGRF